ncbi:zeta toxin family protein [Streptomyces sp. NPDC005900]|uniref:zeta toxin family protein n=1 Tax=Streptomyces sp. NPDC005900 TaxID=3154569 RepID=UPI0033EB97F5
MSGRGLSAHGLPHHELRALVHEEILPALGAAPSDRPRYVVLGGPQGSRKTTLAPLVAEQLGMSQAVRLEGDDLLSFHPHHDGLVQRTGSTFEATKMIASDHEFLYLETVTQLRKMRADVMAVGPYARADFAIPRLAEFRDAGYRTEFATTALHPALTELGVLHRHIQGHGMLAPLDLQKRITALMPQTMTEIERIGAADALHVVGATGVTFSKDRQGDGSWVPRTPIAEAIETTRSVPWSHQVRADFMRRRQEVQHGRGEGWSERLASVDRLAAPMLGTVADAAARDTTRLAALSFPDTAQRATESAPEAQTPSPPTREAPGHSFGTEL